MILVKKVLTLIFLLILCSFNWKKCENFRKKQRNLIAPVASISSTTSFFSSIGDCAMIGDIEHDKKIYYVHNFDKMKDDFTKGSGEYAVSFAKMHGCNSKTQVEYSRIMKGNFNELMSVESADSPEKTYQYLESFFENNQTLKVGCNTKNRSS